ncbi:MAG: cobalamin biosynthesis protein CobD [Alphaproteobacteria bacterium]|nr:cobalamin biosynthesis protein CobD [Hyphomonas sp.]MBR9807697.1 cobalamin biosynthesis protein CobD [Alphaproteobacteria bacterium]|tara:strand:- start:6096 stop:7046 length:951 start_codon:yes stop_codon:yes gene_type:complete
MSSVTMILAAWAIEAAFGWPDWLYRLIRHPVVWLGWCVRWLETRLNNHDWAHRVRYMLGALASLLVISLAALAAYAISRALSQSQAGFLLEALIASSLLASHSLYTHVLAVAEPLAKRDLSGAQKVVSLIVGRDPSRLDEAGVARAALESLAENTSDGVTAPLFWGALFGLPGLAAYKAINTLDSMIGHRNDRYAAFGGFAARLDDVANIVPARLTGLVFALGSASLKAFTVMWQDARHHRSPNAGWPEAAMAGALGVRLSGPRSYGDTTSHEPWLNEGAPDPNAVHLKRGLTIYVRSLALAACLLLILSLLLETL